MKKEFKDKKVAVLGFGIEGQSAVRYMLEQGARVTIFDKREEKEFDSNILKAFRHDAVDFKFGNFSEFSGFSYIVRSPGIKLAHPAIIEAQKKGAILTSATKIFFEESPCEIIGVTGTKGKGTTSSLIYEMLKASGKDVYLGGNIGIPPLDFLSKLTKDSIVVLELSSFQLQDLDRSPHIAVMLMVTQEHLSAWGDQNYHENIEEYIDAKRNIVRFQKASDYAILNRDYPVTLESDIHTDAHVCYVSRVQEVIEGAFIRDGKVITRIEGVEDELIDIKNILLPGAHNLENICAAVVAAITAGVDTKHIVHVLKTFKGLEHRLELVATINGVRYYDDSFSTTPETAIAAIEAFSDPEILVLGGSSKNSDFTELGKVISEKENIKAIIGIGVEWARIKEAIGKTKHQFLLLEGARDMKSIVLAASKIATLGDVVLLSPACASFDMFKNYKERGNTFKEEVLALRN